ncbi:MAG: N-acetylglucosamine-6-phosphate deacetylase [Alphaproteobacteria bacterium]|nr:N-acetylglucosamine-6-phosphate deacetylase [Alphaproteobacteria bacterium]
MTIQAYIADKIVTEGTTITNHALLVENGLVVGLYELSQIPAQAERIALAGLTIAPGLVDAQVNGGGGVQFNDDTAPDGCAKIAAAHMAAGTTSSLITLISGSDDKITMALDAVRTCIEKNIAGVLGIHLEGPYLNPARKGAHDVAIIEKANPAFLLQQKLAGLGACLITLAPERFTSQQLKALFDAGAVLATGHSAATREQLDAAIKSGVTGITHLFNAMGGIYARDPGMSGRALVDDRLACSIIADGAHVSAEALHIADRVKLHGKLFLVSDAMAPAGQNPPQSFVLDGRTVHVKDRQCLDESGALAGSAATLFECVRYAVQGAGFDLAHALAMASIYPARFLNVDDQVGSFQAGRRADIIAFDQEMNLKKVFVGGLSL